MSMVDEETTLGLGVTEITHKTKNTKSVPLLFSSNNYNISNNNNSKSTLKKKSSVPPTTNNKKKSKKKTTLTKTTSKNQNNKKNKSSIFNNPSSVLVDGVGNTNITANMCTHCSRVFCGRKALYVHTLKMHGKEYLQKQAPPIKQNPFSCWFCSASFNSPELVVEHMTQEHENLDKLSKRVEGQNLSVSASQLSPSTGATSRLHQSKGAISKTLAIDRNKNSSGGRKDTQSPNVAAFPRFIPIPSSQHKQMVPVASLRTSSSSSPLTSTATTLDGANQPILARKMESGQQPPAGFKVSYALAYVPVYVPDKTEESCGEDDTTLATTTVSAAVVEKSTSVGNQEKTK